MEWNDEVIARLRTLWDEGHSTAEIGRRLGVSKNAIVGKAHRLSLPPRPSPIRRGTGEAPRPSTRRVVGSTLPPLPAHEAVASARRTAVATLTPSVPSPALQAPALQAPALQAQALQAQAERPAVSQPKPSPSRVSEAPAPLAAVRAMPRRSARLVCCCWPIGEPGTPSFRFCDTDALAGKPYCHEHAQLAYVKVRDRRDEAA